MNKEFVLFYDMNKLNIGNKKQRENTASDILLKKGLRQLTGSEKYSFRYGKWGKPYFADHPDIFFSISHSGQFAACVFSSSEIGLDLQMIPKMDNARFLRVAKRFFSEADYRQLLRVPESELPKHFTDMWTAHEAYVKYTGEGLRVVKKFSTVNGEIIRSGEVIARYRLLPGPERYSVVMCRKAAFT